jgi:hypothetical protein
MFCVFNTYTVPIMSQRGKQLISFSVDISNAFDYVVRQNLKLSKIIKLGIVLNIMKYMY